MTSFFTSLLSALTRRWTRTSEPVGDMRSAERERLLGIVSNVPGVVWEAWGQPDRSTQRINFISDHVTRMLGYTVDEWLSTPNFWLTIVHPDDRDAAAKRAHEHFLAGGPSTNTFRWLTKDGRAIWVESHSTVVQDETGAPIGMRGVTLDISARKRAEESLRFASKASEALAASLDYEQTLQAIVNLAVPALADACTITLIDEQGEARDVAASGSLTGASDELVVSIDTLDRKLGTIRFASATPSRYDEHDRELASLLARRVSMAIENAHLYRTVAANAAKFGQSGGRIDVVVEREGNVARVIVSDDGEGIEPEFLPHVFDRFRQGESGSTRSYSGLGLGLAIVQHLVELHGGTVSEASDGRGEGATFVIELPVAEKPKNVFPDLRRKQVLVVDREEATLDVITDLLQQWGARVTPARSATEAILALHAHYDLVITDVGMAVAEGVTLAQQLRQANGGLPAIVLRKPIDPIELATEIALAFSRSDAG